MIRSAILVGIGAVMASMAGETLVHTAFGAFPRPPEHVLDEATNPRVSGVLPDGWQDDSSWAPVWITYSFEDEQGTRFLRTKVTRLDSGRAQLTCFPLADCPGDRLYRLAFRARHLTGGSVTFGLRQRGQPYAFYWQRTEKLSANWGTYSYEFAAGKNDQPMGFWFNLDATGVFDLGEVTLERLSDQDVIAEIKVNYPDGGPANLFRNTRFPLGLQNGWSLDRDSSDGDVVVCGPATGADYPALQLDAPEGTTLSSEPFAVVYPVVEHDVSLSLKGEGEWHLTVSHNGRLFADSVVRATPEWQRVTLRFSPKIGIPFYQLRLAGTGALWLDRLQACPRTKSSEYTPPGDAEVALRLPGTYAAAAARVVFLDEGPVRMEGCVTGVHQGTTVHGSLYDVYGTVQDLVPVTPAASGNCGWDLTPYLASRPLGSFRLEAWGVRDGETVSPINELVFHRVKRPRYWGQDAPASPFGVHTNSTTRHLLMAKAIGLNWTRLHDAGLPYFGWWNLELEKGTWRFFDRELQRYRQHHIKIFAELGTAPPWASYYSETGLTSFGYFDKFFQPKNLDDYATYVRTVCERYKGVIDAFDVWNEPWIHAWWGVAYDHEKGGRAGYVTSKEPQRDFAALTKVARDTARAVIPEALVLGFNTTTGDTSGEQSFSGYDWTKGVLEAGGMANCDGIAYHAYTGGGVGYPGDTVEQGLAVALGPIHETMPTVPKPVWMTEGSPLIHRVGNGLYRHTVPGAPTEDVIEDADRIARYLISMLANGVERIFLYSMHAQGDFMVQPKEWNVFTTDEGYLHPSGVAQAHCAWLLEDTRFAERLALHGDTVQIYVFAGAVRAVAAVSSRPGDVSLTLPSAPDALITDLFGNPLPGGSPFSGRVVYVSVAGADGVERLRNMFMPR